ncbi:hypothetical protein HOF56_00790 [Candidatus Peribacteria bacterium]|jgi:hypothetical protein|nr:hypothetical protein [Candidatus Peribacteria bacterium]MBT4021355.1 hypothetical protein [Candidatus Peribacteria bacterium]MBT4241255.1 hypothetical protein [Candidatus Peribacteria bacterium]MBT4474280.1 hypothetical protein [Candidatus Peribacteria bacterium]
MKYLLVCVGVGLAIGFMMHEAAWETASAEGRCGDGICSVMERKPNSYCRLDCGSGSRKGWCGNGTCELHENCNTCPGDCGSCTHNLYEEKGVCGDSTCSIHESCSKCPGDCGRCSKSFIWRTAYKLRRAMRLVGYYVGKGFRFVGQFKDIDAAVAYIEERKEQMHENAVQRSEAAEELLAFLDEYDNLKSSISEFDKNLIANVSDDGESAGVANIVPSKRITYSIKKAVKKEQNKVVEVTNHLMEDPVLRAKLAKNTYIEEQIKEASNKMNTGIGRVYSGVMFWKDSEDEASKILAEEWGEDIYMQKKSMRAFLDEEMDGIDKLLEFAGSRERSSFELFLIVWHEDLDEAKTKSDLASLAGSMNKRISDIEIKARANRGWFRKTVYPIQDLFGIGT